MTYKCLERFDDYQMAYYEELCDYFKGRLHLLERLKAFLEEAVSYNEFCIRVRPSTLPSIIQDNKIRQKGEVGGGASFGNMDHRKQVMKMLFNCRNSQMEPADYPVFGYLADPQKGGELIANADMSHQYGSLLIVLKKENLMERTTMSYGDSVNMAACTRLIPTRVNKIYPTCFQSITNENAGEDGKFMAPPTASWYVQNLCMALDDGRLDPHALYKINDVFDGRWGSEFIELQYHGEILFDRDVKAVYGMPFADEDEDIMAKYKPLLKEMGIKTRFFDLFTFCDTKEE